MSAEPTKVNDEEWEQLCELQLKLSDAKTSANDAANELSKFVAKLLRKYKASQGWLIDDDRVVRKMTPDEKQRVAAGQPL